MTLIPGRTFSANVGDKSTGSAGPDALEVDIEAILQCIRDALDASYGHKHTGNTNDGAKLPMTSIEGLSFSQVPIWSGTAIYLLSTHTITPTKKLSECNNGWILLWSDYDNGVGANDWDWVATYIPKQFATLKNGQLMNHPIPNYATGAGSGQIVKKVRVYDDKIVGDDDNGSSTSGANDVALRYILPF